MQLPGIDGLAFLAFLLILVPLGARRTARALRAGEPCRPAITRERYWRSAITFQLVLFVFAWLVGSGFGYRIFALGGLSVRGVALAALALGACLALRFAMHRMRSESELRGLEVYRRAPRTPRERRLFVVVVLLAAVAEEAAYRGVGWSVLWYSLGNGWISAAILSFAFALAHWSQGWKSLIAILLIALIFHGLMALTGVLVLAMVAHAVYDLVMGTLIQRKAAQLEALEPTSA